MANIRRMTKRRLGDILLHEGLIHEEQLARALEEQKQSGERVGEILVRKGYVTETDIARTICAQFSFPFLSVSHYYVAPELVHVFPLEFIERHLFVPIDRFGDVLSVVIAGLLDEDVIDEIERESKCTVQVYVGTVSEVKQVIREKFIGDGAAADQAAREQRAAAQAAGTDVVRAEAAAREGDGGDAAADIPDIEDLLGIPEGKPRDAGGIARTDKAVVKELEKQFDKSRRGA